MTGVACWAFPVIPVPRVPRRSPIEPAALSAAIRDLGSPDVLAAYLFGSHAAGRPHREGDVDVAVLLSRHLDGAAGFAIRVRLAAELPSRLGVRDVDVVVLNDAPPHFARRIVLDGRELCCRDPKAAHAFRRDVQLRAADLAPFLAKTRRLKLVALAS